MLNKNQDKLENINIYCSVGIFIHNESDNISNLLDAFLGQKLEQASISEIFVVSSASTDGSDEIVRTYCEKDKRLKLITESERRGKSAAINKFLSFAKENIVIICSGDIIPAESTVESMLRPFLDKEVGMTGCHPIPVNSENTFCGYLINLQWRLHHRISLKTPKMGEMVAFRKVIQEIPSESAVDEASIEVAILNKRLRLIYVPEALVFNKGPENLADFIKQRRRIAAGHKWLKKNNQYKVSTNNPLTLFSVFFAEIIESPSKFIHLSLSVMLESYARLLGWYDLVVKKKNPYKWDRISTTKKVK